MNSLSYEPNDDCHTEYCDRCCELYPEDQIKLINSIQEHYCIQCREELLEEVRESL